MTAIVGILNKRSVALAADSAVTIDCENGHKVLNSANKVFNISLYHPVGLMMYSSATFMDTPWELIIKMYSNNLKDKYFPTLQGYVEDFILYLKNNHFFCSEEQQKRFLLRHMLFYCNDIIENAKENCARKNEDTKDNISNDAIYEEIINILSLHTTRFSTFPKCPDFLTYSLSELETYAVRELDEIQKNYSEYIKDIEQFRTIFTESFYTYICSCHILFDMTGLVFVGYGNDEIYPSLIPVNITFAIKEKLRYSIDIANEQHINEINKSAICPFAQTDVMITILTGIDRGIQNLVYDTFDKTITRFMNTIIDTLQSQNVSDEVTQSLSKNIDIPKSCNFFENTIKNYINDEYIKKLLKSIEFLDKIDIANAAEHLISLTNLKRKMTLSEESVGGPIDVAVISKCDGFIWMKKKDYINKEFNPHFFHRNNN